MWSLFSRDPAKDFPYEVGEKVTGLEDKSLWSLHEGKHKSTGEVVSIFAFDLKGSSESQIQLGKASFKRFKTLRHPNILTFLNGLESDKVIYVVTEPLVPLETYLKNNEQYGSQNELAISWGLHQLTKGLSFLINDCNLIHNNVCMSSVFVDRAGEWKLGGVDYMYPASGPDSLPTIKILPALEKYDAPEKVRTVSKPSEKWSADMWGLGCLIWEVFNGSLPQTSALKSLGKMPKSLVAHYCELVGANPKARPNPAKFIESCRARGGFMNNKFVDTMLFLEEIQIKEQNEKNHFFNSLAPVLDTFPQPFCKHKILPQLIHAFEYGNAGSAVLMPMFKLGKLVDTDEYQKKIVPCVVKLFSSTDRATRVKLLQQVELFVDYLSPEIVNTKIFPSVCQGFMDTNPVVREHTIKSMLHLAAKLNYKNLNEELLKHFARLQSKDDQGGIRTNTTVCLGKIAGNLNPQMRQKVLSSAYLRALKDPFPPARQAGIVAMAATHNFFTLREAASRLLPSLCGMTMDPDKNVRDQAFKGIRCFLGKLEKVSEDPELMADIEKDVNTGGTPSSIAASWAGWAVSGVGAITSKIYRKGPKGTSPPKQHPTAGSAAAAAEELGEPEEKEASPERVPHSRPTPAPPSPDPQGQDGADVEGVGWEADGWDEDENWGNMEDDAVESPGSDVKTDGWEADDFESLEDAEPVEQKGASHARAMTLEVKKDASPWGHADFAPVDGSELQSASSYNWGGDVNNDSFFSAMISDTKKPGLKFSRPSSATSSSSGSQRSVPKATSQSSASHALSGKGSSTGNYGSAARASGGTKSSMSSGWEDSGWAEDDGGAWGNDDWDGNDAENQGLSKADLAKKKREEKNRQRQKELEEKRAARQAGAGAMRLGAKKYGVD